MKYYFFKTVKDGSRNRFNPLPVLLSSNPLKEVGVDYFGTKTLLKVVGYHHFGRISQHCEATRAMSYEYGTSLSDFLQEMRTNNNLLI